jgi:hypothetical protein
LVFWNLFEFSLTEITEKSIYLPHSESKSYRINSIKSFSSRSFQQHQKTHCNSWEIFSEKIIQYSRTWTPQVHATFLLESFPKRPRTWSETLRSVDHICTSETNKLPCFLDRLHH